MGSLRDGMLIEGWKARAVGAETDLGRVILELSQERFMRQAAEAESEHLRADYLSYHNAVGGIFLAAGQTPYKICKQIWALHADRSAKLAMEATK